VLDDLIGSGAVPSTRLTEIFRQAARSLVIRAAHAINRGEAPPTAAGEDDVRDFFLVRREGPSAIFDEVVSLATERLPRHYGLVATADVQVLSPMHKGPLGTDAFNTALRDRLNPDGAPIPGTPLRVGDRVMQTRNNHERQFYNGEVAVVANLDRERGAVSLVCDDGRRLRLDLNELGTIAPAYCSSVHKLQGSQVPLVVVVLSRAHAHMLTRNLLYTAVTRTMTGCVVVHEPGALETALGRVDARRRHTRLAELVGGRAVGAL
jgi:exodeoxyribonuclease V alpha subunit